MEKGTRTNRATKGRKAMIDKIQVPIEYGNTTDRLDTLENRLRLTKKTLHEVAAFANGLEAQIHELQKTVSALKKG
jgi:hypothetical protein